MVAIFQALPLKYPDNDPENDFEFVVRFSFFIYGCLTSIIIVRPLQSLLTASGKRYRVLHPPFYRPYIPYPTAIIFLVALNYSHLEGGFAENAIGTTPVSTHVGPFLTTTNSFDGFSRQQAELRSDVSTASPDSANADVAKNV